MKLVDLLAKELNKWPSSVARARQDADLEICFEGDGGSSVSTEFDFFASVLADDANCCGGVGDFYVTKQQWQKARNKLKEKQVNKDGWIRNRGNKEFTPNCMYDVRYRDGRVKLNASVITFLHAKNCGPHGNENTDVMAWRPHKKEEIRPTEVDPRVIAAKSGIKFDPIAKRDEAIKINEELHKMYEEYNDKLKKYESIRKELRDQGFELIEKK